MLCQLQLQRNYPRCSLNKKLDAPHSTPGRFGKQNSVVVGSEYRLRGLQPVAWSLWRLSYPSSLSSSLLYPNPNTASFVFNCAVPWRWWLVFGLSPQKPGLDSRSVPTTFLMDRVQWDRFFLQGLQFHPCECRSAGKQCSSIHASPMLNNLSNWQCR